jgi:8-oxo-dGTP pyrophosphatase MutT (NUDIX family)
MSEIIDLYDDMRRVVQTAEYRAPLPVGLRKLFVHIWFVHPNGQFLLQQRVSTAHRFANKWTQTGGCVRSGESVWECVCRESNEELGLTPDVAQSFFIKTLVNIDSFTDLWIVFNTTPIQDVILQPDEVQNVKWVSADEIREMQTKDLLTPSMIPELEIVTDYLSEI